MNSKVRQPFKFTFTNTTQKVDSLKHINYRKVNNLNLWKSNLKIFPGTQNQIIIIRDETMKHERGMKKYEEKRESNRTSAFSLIKNSTHNLENIQIIVLQDQD